MIAQKRQRARLRLRAASRLTCGKATMPPLPSVIIRLPCGAVALWWLLAVVWEQSAPHAVLDAVLEGEGQACLAFGAVAADAACE